MWDKLWSYINKVISLTRTTEKNTEDIAEVSEKLSDIERGNERRDDKVDYITQAVQRIAFEHESDRKNAETEREMQRLRLENLLLQATQRLPPGQTLLDSEKEALREANEMLKREVEELRKRLEQLEQK